MSLILLPKASPLFIDKLSMTLDIPEHEQQIVAKIFQHDLPGFFGGKLHQSKLYILNIKLYLEGVGQILFQCQPKEKNNNFFRVEWTPAKVETETVADIVNLIVPGGYADLINHGRITRIDITTDVKNLKMGDALFRYPGIAISYNYLKAGSIQTAYLGTKGGINQFKFYDKAQQIKEINETKPQQYKEPLPKHPTTRIEWEYRPKKICTFANIDETCKPIYKKLWCAMAVNLAVPPTTDIAGHINSVIKISHYEGFQQALYAIPKFRRAEVRDYIESNTDAAWWSPESLWQTFPEAIEHIVNPVPNKWTGNQ